MDQLPGFSWPLPRAFAAAVAICRFEQGDVFYDCPEAYASWRSDVPGGGWLQVLDPPRSARGAPADALGNRFEANWHSPVTIEVGEPQALMPRTIESTQGRLFHCLWRGGRDVLSGAERETGGLPLPRMARDLQKHLESAAPALLGVAERRHGVMFVCVVDESSEASLAKARSVESALTAGSDVEVVELAPSDAGVPDGEAFHPTLRLRGTIVSETADFVTQRLKAALYVPVRSREEGEADRFRLERHGHLLELP